MSENKFYVTTPIYYATAAPHLGSLYSTLLADVAARWNKLLGKKVFFLTGTDEHGQKIAQAAQKSGKEPKEFVDSFIDAYKNAWHDFHIEYDKFIRTTDKEHTEAVQKWLSDLIKKGEIYKNTYEGWYCTPCETFITEKDLDEHSKEVPKCPSCGRETSFVSEECYFFKLSAYQEKLLKLYKDHPDFVIPKERLNEVIRFVESGLKDLCISRTTVTWGIPFPGDERHVTYVWADALNNYITAIGYGDPSREKEFNYWWPADLQVLGKDILRFHAVYWPAFLMATGIELPKHLLAHGWIKINQQKMSKSFGNVVNPKDLLTVYGADPVRYYLVSQLAITQDAEYSTQALEQTISADLANDIGNLLNRTIVLAEKNNLLKISVVKEFSKESEELRQDSIAMINEYSDYMNNCHYHLAIARLRNFSAKVNAYFHAQEPWKVAKTDFEKFKEVISVTCHGLEIIAKLLWPVMPEKMNELLDRIGTKFEISINQVDELLKSNWRNEFLLKLGETLFIKYEQKVMEEKKEQVIEQKEQMDFIGIEDFIKVKLAVGTIEECEEVEGSDKLLKMQVNFGEFGKKQILAGVRKFFSKEDLIGKQGVFVLNLKPRKLMGLESQGMMLVSEDENGKLQRTVPTGKVPNGSLLR